MFNEILTQELFSNTTMKHNKIWEIFGRCHQKLIHQSRRRVYTKGNDNEVEINNEYRKLINDAVEQVVNLREWILNLEDSPGNKLTFTKKSNELLDEVLNEKRMLEERDLSLRNFKTSENTLKATQIVLVITILLGLYQILL